MSAAVWSFRVVRHEPARILTMEGRAGHLAWTFSAMETIYGPTMQMLGVRWVIECNDVEVATGRGIPSVPLAFALVVDALAPYLAEVSV